MENKNFIYDMGYSGLFSYLWLFVVDKAFIELRYLVLHKIETELLAILNGTTGMRIKAGIYDSY